MPIAETQDFAATAIPYRAVAAHDGWPDWGVPHWQAQLDAEGLSYVLQRQQHVPLPLAPIDEFVPASLKATATHTVAGTSRLVATHARPGDANAFTATICGPRPENTAITFAGLEPTTLPAGSARFAGLAQFFRQAPHPLSHATARCAARDNGRTRTVLLAPISALPMTLEVGPSTVLLGLAAGQSLGRPDAAGTLEHGAPAALWTTAIVGMGVLLGTWAIARRSKKRANAGASEYARLSTPPLEDNNAARELRSEDEDFDPAGDR